MRKRECERWVNKILNHMAKAHAEQVERDTDGRPGHSQRVTAFLQELADVCKKYGLCIGWTNTHWKREYFNALTVERLNEQNLDSLLKAHSQLRKRKKADS